MHCIFSTTGKCRRTSMFNTTNWILCTFLTIKVKVGLKLKYRTSDKTLMETHLILGPLDTPISCGWEAKCWLWVKDALQNVSHLVRLSSVLCLDLNPHCTLVSNLWDSRYQASLRFVEWFSDPTCYSNRTIIEWVWWIVSRLSK